MGKQKQSSSNKKKSKGKKKSADTPPPSPFANGGNASVKELVMFAEQKTQLLQPVEALNLCVGRASEP